MRLKRSVNESEELWEWEWTNLRLRYCHITRECVEPTNEKDLKEFTFHIFRTTSEFAYQDISDRVKFFNLCIYIRIVFLGWTLFYNQNKPLQHCAVCILFYWKNIKEQLNEVLNWRKLTYGIVCFESQHKKLDLPHITVRLI